MQIKFEITGVDAVRAQLNRLSGPEALKAIRMGLNRVGRIAQTEADRAIRERFNIAQHQVRGSFVFLSAKADGSRAVSATLSIFGSPTKRGRSMNMVRFLKGKGTLSGGRRRKLKGVKPQLIFSVARGGGLKTIDGAFLGNKGRTVFRRTGSGRLPIEPVQVIGVAQMFNTRTVRQRVFDRVNESMAVEMQRAIDLMISRR